MKHVHLNQFTSSAPTATHMSAADCARSLHPLSSRGLPRRRSQSRPADGLVKNFRSKRGVAHFEMVRSPDYVSWFWKFAAAAVTRENPRLARELEIALPHELPLDTQIRLVRGLCLWLHDRHKLNSMAAIHHPWRDMIDRKIAENLVPNTEGNEATKPYRSDDLGNPRKARS